MLKYLHRFTFRFSVIAFALVSSVGPALAEQDQHIEVEQVLGDGKNGNVFRDWGANLREATISRVTAVVQRVRGGNDTYVNLRFGDGGTFDNGKRVPVGSQTQEVSWNVGSAPNGKPLVLKAYSGEVLLKSLTIYFQDSIADAPRGRDDRHGDTRDRDYRDRDDRYGDGRQGGNDYREDRNNYDNRNSEPRDTRAPSDPELQRSCARGRYRGPELEVGSLQPTGGLFSGKYRFRGSAFGSCIEELAYFEEGRLKERVQFPFAERFQRQEFEVKVRSGRQGEIRVYSSNGGSDSVAIDRLLEGQQQQQPAQGGNIPLPFDLN